MDLVAITSTLAFGLPIQARWTIDGVPLDFYFTASRDGLRPLPEFLLDMGEPEWQELLVFGQQDYADGGGARPCLCVSRTDGAVCGFDAEQEHPTFPLNSSVERFVNTFQFLDNFLGKDMPLPFGFEGVLQTIDPETYPNSDWRLLVECLRSDKPDDAAERDREAEC